MPHPPFFWGMVWTSHPPFFLGMEAIPKKKGGKKRGDPSFFTDGPRSPFFLKAILQKIEGSPFFSFFLWIASSGFFPYFGGPIRGGGFHILFVFFFFFFFGIQGFLWSVPGSQGSMTTNTDVQKSSCQRMQGGPLPPGQHYGISTPLCIFPFWLRLATVNAKILRNS